MDIMECIKSRRSARAYLPDAVDRNMIELCITAGLYAPSAHNRQAWHFAAISDTALLLRLNDVVKTAMGKSDRESYIKRSKSKEYNFYYNAPTLIIVSCSQNAMYPREDCGCALENILLCANSLALGSCWIHQLSDDMGKDHEVRKVLTEAGVPENHNVYGCAAIGHINTTPDEIKRVGSVSYR